ncbi:hypothetical protein Hanom_Chr02g00120941 [Helianthus anomalus]
MGGEGGGCGGGSGGGRHCCAGGWWWFGNCRLLKWNEVKPKIWFYSAMTVFSKG